MSSLTVLRPGLLVVLLVLAAVTVVAWRRWPPPLSRGRSRLTLFLRLAMLAALMLALAGLRVTSPPDRRAVVAVVDLSDSARAGEEAAVAAVQRLIESKGADDLLGVVTFGRDAQVELPPTKAPAFDGFQTRPDPGYSNIGAALQLAANLVPDGYGRQVVLISDGRQNVGDAPAAVAGLKTQRVRVDVVPVGAAPGAETSVLALVAPPLLREGQDAAVTARLRATAPASGVLTVELDGREVARRDVTLPEGVSDQRFDLPPLPPGVHRFRAVLDARPDRYSQNNLAEAVVRALGRPVVLLLEGAPGSGANVASALWAGGMDVDVRRAEDAPSDAPGLVRYDSVVLADTRADAFPEGALAALAISVKDLGRGLVAVGGTNSFGPGGWEGTPLEQALPVRMAAPRPKQRPKTAVMVVMETMEYADGDRVGLGAIQGVLDQLGPTDDFGMVNLHQGGSHVAIPLTAVTDPPGLMRRVQETALGDPPGYGSGLKIAVDALAASDAAIKHVVIVADGDAVADIGTYDPIVGTAQRQGVIITAVGVDTHHVNQFMDHMRLIAQLGGGGFYLSRTATDIPRVLLRASKATIRPWFEQQQFFPRVTSAGDLLDGVPLDAFPGLDGYVVTTPKPEADVALSTPDDDPLLAGWQYGLGRSVAWTSDSQGRWTTGLLASPVSATLFARMVAWSLPVPPAGGLNVEAVAGADGLEVTVSSPEASGDVDVDVVGPDQTATSERLRRVAPGRWAGRSPVGPLGTYVVHATLLRSGLVVAQSELAVPIPYSPEYLDLGRDDALLGRLAGQGGALLAEPSRAWKSTLPSLAVSRDAFWAVLALVALAWPVDVAVRRLNLSPRQALSVLRDIVRFRRPSEVEVVVPEGLARLRERLARRNADDEPEPASTPFVEPEEQRQA